jgi:Flp pilus assembly protein TadG
MTRTFPSTRLTFPRTRAFRLRRKKAARHGAAVVELAMVLPLLCTITLGMISIGQSSIVCTGLAAAARNGAGLAASPTSTNATVTARIKSVLTAGGITANNATITILVNGASADVSTSNANDEITITVSIAASQTSVMTFGVPVFQNATFTRTISIMRQ